MPSVSHEPDDILDDEIIEIFVEEAEEVIAELDVNLPRWQDDPSNREVVGEIRRAYHTIKGSGRMVKAMEIADVALRVEQMLTKALDGGVAISSAMIEVVGNTRNVLPALVDAFRNHQAISIAGINLELLREQIEAVTRGEQFQVVQTASAPPILHVPDSVEKTTSTSQSSMAADILHAEMFELMRRVDVCAGSADEALTESRKIAEKLAQLQVDTQDLVSQSDLSEYRVQMQALAKELQELRHFVKASTEQTASQVAESRSALERRISEKVAAFAEAKNDLSSEIIALRQQLANMHHTMFRIAGGCAGGAFLLSVLMMWLLK